VKKDMDKYATVNSISNNGFNNFEKINKYDSFRKVNKKRKINIIGVHKITIPNKEEGKKIFNVEEKETNNNPNIQDKNYYDNIIFEKNMILNGKKNNIKSIYNKKEKYNDYKEKKIFKRNSYDFNDNMNLNNTSPSKETINKNMTQKNINVSKENKSRNKETIDHNYLQTEINKESDMTKENKKKLFNIINNKNHVTELGQKYLKTFRKVNNNKQNFINTKTSKIINVNSNVMKEKKDKKLSSLLENNLNTDSKVNIETSLLIPNNEVSNIVQEQLKKKCENKTIKKFEIISPIKVNKVKDKIFKSFKLKSIKSKVLFNNVKKYNNNNVNSRNEQSLSRSYKKMVVMKIIRTNSIINNSSYLNTENRFSVTHNSTKRNRNSEDFDNNTQTKFYTTSKNFLNKNYITASKLNMPKNPSNEEYTEKKNPIANHNRIEKKKGFVIQEISPYKIK
jgi:hypothetical protein